ncbi:MAG: hypothetical protein ACLPQY_02690 [Streptosporangiaceae bacterium]
MAASTSRSSRTLRSSTVNGQRSPALGTVTVPASYQPNSSATRVQVGDPGVIAYITGEIFPIDGGQLMAARSQVTDGTCTGLVTRGFCRL